MSAPVFSRPLPADTVQRVHDIHHAGLRLQLSRDPFEAARAAQEPGRPLRKYLIAQCKWRGIDPAPYLKQLELELAENARALGAEA